MMLLVVTVVLTLGFAALGFMQKKSFDSNTQKYASASSRLQQMKSMAGYPSAETVEELEGSLADYQKVLEETNSALSKVTIVGFTNVAPGQFASKLEKAQKDTEALYKSKGIDLPKDWYLGFEKYMAGPAPKNATGILQYQLDAIVWLHEELAKHQPDALVNVYRKPLPQESKVVETKSSKSRKSDEPAFVSMPIEIVFSGQEANARGFINALVKSEDYLFTIDTLKLKSKNFSKKDVESETTAVDTSSSSNMMIDDIFSDDGDSDTFEPDPSLDNTKIFEQVLGQEQVSVFIDLNLVYLPQAVELPK